MRIVNNNQGILQLFSNKNFLFAGTKNQKSNSNAKAIDDLLSGRRKILMG